MEWGSVSIISTSFAMPIARSIFHKYFLWPRDMFQRAVVCGGNANHIHKFNAEEIAGD